MPHRRYIPTRAVFYDSTAARSLAHGQAFARSTTSQNFLPATMLKKVFKIIFASVKSDMSWR